MKTSLFLGLLMGAQHTWAYFETGESAEIQKKGIFRVGLMPQLRLSDGSGLNFTGFCDTALSESSSLRVLAGGGETDFYTGGSYKWIPIPDYDRQPAIGAKFEVIYARIKSDSAVALRVHPLISKKFDTDHGVLIPYVSLPFGTHTYQSTTQTPVNFVTGTEFISPNVDNMQFGAELGLNANKSFSYISAFAVIFIDENNRPRK
jgi:hypothetical protein